MSEYEQQKSLYKEVQRALWTEWDPIGVNTHDDPGPSNEYDGYAAAVLRSLNSGEGERGLARFSTRSSGTRWASTVPMRTLSMPHAASARP